jgi:hypothetical protein
MTIALCLRMEGMINIGRGEILFSWYFLRNTTWSPNARRIFIYGSHVGKTGRGEDVGRKAVCREVTSRASGHARSYDKASNVW